MRLGLNTLGTAGMFTVLCSGCFFSNPLYKLIAFNNCFPAPFLLVFADCTGYDNFPRKPLSARFLCFTPFVSFAQVTMFSRALHRLPCFPALCTGYNVFPLFAPVTMFSRSLHRLQCFPALRTGYNVFPLFAPVTMFSRALHRLQCFPALCTGYNVFPLFAPVTMFSRASHRLLHFASSSGVLVYPRFALTACCSSLVQLARCVIL